MDAETSSSPLRAVCLPSPKRTRLEGLSNINTVAKEVHKAGGVALFPGLLGFGRVVERRRAASPEVRRVLSKPAFLTDHERVEAGDGHISGFRILPCNVLDKLG